MSSRELRRAGVLARVEKEALNLVNAAAITAAIARTPITPASTLRNSAARRTRMTQSHIPVLSGKLAFFFDHSHWS